MVEVQARETFPAGENTGKVRNVVSFSSLPVGRAVDLACVFRETRGSLLLQS